MMIATTTTKLTTMERVIEMRRRHQYYCCRHRRNKCFSSWVSSSTFPLNTTNNNTIILLLLLSVFVGVLLLSLSNDKYNDYNNNNNNYVSSFTVNGVFAAYAVVPSSSSSSYQKQKHLLYNRRISSSSSNSNIPTNRKLVVPTTSSSRSGTTTTSLLTTISNSGGGDDSMINMKQKFLKNLSSSSSSIRNIIGTKDIISILSVISFIGIDIVFRRLFQYYTISFPSSLGACGILFLLLVLFQSSKVVNNYIVSYLQYGAIVLSKWLPVFFVPSLITLPLNTSLDTSNTIEMIKIISILIIGFFYTLLSTSYSVTLLRYVKKNVFTTIKSNNNNTNDTSSSSSSSTLKTAVTSASSSSIVPPNTATTTTTTTTTKPFSDVLFTMLCIGTGTTGIGCILSNGTSKLYSLLFLLCTTLCTFVYGTRLPNTIKKIIHPLVTCTTLSWTMILLLSKVIGTSYRSLLVSYKTGYLSKNIIASSGAGDILLFLLGPAVVSLAISMYEKRQLMKQNIYELCTAISVSTLGGLYGTALLVRFFNILGTTSIRLSLLSRNITSPLAMAIANILGADVSLAVSMVVITGLFGANFGATILNSFGIYDPVARGLGIGAAAHGLGTAAFTNEKDAFPFAAISMALTASAATVAVSIPFIRKSLIQLTIGA